MLALILHFHAIISTLPKLFYTQTRYCGTVCNILYGLLYCIITELNEQCRQYIPTGLIQQHWQYILNSASTAKQNISILLKLIDSPADKRIDHCQKFFNDRPTKTSTASFFPLPPVLLFFVSNHVSKTHDLSYKCIKRLS